MPNFPKFISDTVPRREGSMDAAEMEASKERVTREIKGRKVCVIGGAANLLGKLPRARCNRQKDIQICLCL